MMKILMGALETYESIYHSQQHFTSKCRGNGKVHSNGLGKQRVGFLLHLGGGGMSFWKK